MKKTLEGNLKTRFESFIDERLHLAYWAAVKHFGTTDLVICFDDREEVDPVAGYVREKLLSASDVSDDIKEKVSRPATEVEGSFSSADAAYWLVLIFANGERACGVVRAKLLAEHGNA